MARRRKPAQLALNLERNWGGRRAGSGRKPKADRAEIPHQSRIGVDERTPAHVTLRVRTHVWNLRSGRSFRVISHALTGALLLPDFRVVHFAVLGNHIHLIVEANEPSALTRGVKSISCRLARGLNRMMDARGPVLTDRYHSRPLRTPTEVANALEYVLRNFASHARRRGEELPPEFEDPYASSAPRNRHLVSAPQTWLLREGWRRASK